MWEFENWKNEIIDSIKNLHEETKAIREHLEEEKEEIENGFDNHKVQEEEGEEKEDLDNDEDDEEFDITNMDEKEILILEKLDEINDSINIINKIVVEGSIVISITIIIALAFHYFVNQFSKW